jgi:hypothetical protein
MNQRLVIWIALFVMLILLTSAAAAAGPPQYIVRHVIASGGEQVAAGSFVLRGTLGEPVAGPVVSAGAYQKASGFWRVLRQPPRLYLPMVIREP